MCDPNYVREFMRHSDQWSREWNRETLLEYLAQHGIQFEETVHDPVYTMAESAELNIPLRGSRCKNLLVRDKEGLNRFLVVTSPDASIDLGALGRQLGAGRLSLCPPEEMQRILHVGPGSLSPLALVADVGPEKVRLLLDESLRANSKFLFHPLVNTSTISITSDGLRVFVESTGHTAEFVDVPSRAVPADE